MSLMILKNLGHRASFWVGWCHLVYPVGVSIIRMVVFFYFFKVLKSLGLESSLSVFAVSSHAKEV